MTTPTTPGAPHATSLPAAHAVGDTVVLLGRSMRHITRSLDTIITVTIMPIGLMLLFVYVLGGAIDTRSPGRYVDYLLPGILLVTIVMGVSYTAFRLFTDVQSGMFERFRSMPIARSSALWAHVLASVVSNLVSLALVVLVALVMGFRTSAGVAAWLAVAGLLILFTLAMTWVAVIAGLSATTVDGVGAFSYPVIVLAFLSSAFVPTGTMPAPVRAFAQHQPVTSVVDAIRELFTRQPVGTDLALAAVWCLALLVVAYGLAMATYHRRLGRS
jgi:ABC-2 type transport system permease protein